MADIADDFGPGIPLAGFRFSTGQLDAWFDGRVRRLRAGLDYPRDLTLPAMRRRLELAASKREGTGRVWETDGERYICLTLWKS